MALLKDGSLKLMPFNSLVPIVDLLTAAKYAVLGKTLAHAMGVASQSSDYDSIMIASLAIRGSLSSAEGFCNIGSYAHTGFDSVFWGRLDILTSRSLWRIFKSTADQIGRVGCKM
mmetsp:Transcript_46193/g.55600  ORF Transcript_46193/g.55600 Transcript_46193/m.55600 type:complete len:115 (+) Transcript_46193:1807-2151(+)